MVGTRHHASFNLPGSPLAPIDAQWYEKGNLSYHTSEKKNISLFLIRTTNTLRAGLEDKGARFASPVL